MMLDYKIMLTANETLDSLTHTQTYEEQVNLFHI